MIILKVWKASTLCTAMSAAVFAVMMTAFAIQAACGTEPPAEKDVPAMAMVLTDEQAQTVQTPSADNLFYLPDLPAAETASTPKPSIRFEIVRPAQTEAPQEKKRILIYHTHTWEAYEPTEEDPYVQTERWRTKDENHNIVRVGAELASCLSALGFEVVHEKEAFEPPVLSTAYTRSLEMLEAYAARGEAFDYYIDLHRDAYSEGAYSSNTLAGADGEELARMMMLVGNGTGGTGGEGFDVKPQWEENLVLAQTLTDSLNGMIDGLCGKVKIKTGRFNQHVSTRAILIEVGNNKNTLAQAIASMPYLAQAIREADLALSGL